VKGAGNIVVVLAGIAFLVFGRQFALLNLRPFRSRKQLKERNKPGHRGLRIAFGWVWATNIVVGLVFIYAGLKAIR
jgi:hypothetical protein